MLTQKLRFAAFAALAALMSALTAPSALAVIYVGSWEPPYGSPFITPDNPDALFWTGTAQFDVPGNCGTTNETWTIGNSCGAQVLSAQVNFSAASAPNTILKSIFWSSGGPNFPGAITNLMFVNGKLEQVDTSLFDYVSPSPFDPAFGGTYPGYSVDFALRFFIGFGEIQGRNGPFLRWRQADCTTECAGGWNDDINYPPQFTIVPEPTTVTLLAGALLAAGVARRRRLLRTSGRLAR